MYLTSATIFKCSLLLLLCLSITFVVCNSQNCTAESSCLCPDNQIWNNKSKCIPINCTSRFPSEPLDRYTGFSIENLIWLDEEDNQCKLKIVNDSAPYNTKRFHYTLDEFTDLLVFCPKNSKLFDGGEFYKSRNTTLTNEGDSCICDDGYLPSKDFTNCIIPDILHGEVCNFGQVDYCALKRGLTCDPSTNTCLCEHKNYNATWNEEDKLCYSDFDCKERWQPYFSFTAFFESETGKCKEMVNENCKDSNDCPVNSTCVNNYCRCIDGLESNYADKKCLPPKLHGESCQRRNIDEAICSRARGLDCSETKGICQCNYRSQLDKLDNSCRLLRGEKCFDGMGLKCGRTATCQIKVNYDHRLKSETVCTCLPGFKSSRGSCIGTYQDSCLNNESCSLGLECVDGSCKCRDGIQEVYDSDLSMCLSLAGSTCDLEILCIANSFCNMTNSICECSPEFPHQSNGYCYKTIDSTCNANECDLSKGLACMNGKCKCIDSSLVFYHGIGCVSKIGSQCDSAVTLFPAACSLTNKANCANYFKVNCELKSYCKKMDKGISICTELENEEPSHLVAGTIEP